MLTGVTVIIIITIIVIIDSNLQGRGEVLRDLLTGATVTDYY